MRIQAMSLGLVMMMTTAAPALAQGAPPAEPVAPFAPLAPLRATTTASVGAYNAPQQTEWNSPGMAAGGTVLTVIGGASAALGAGTGFASLAYRGGGGPNYGGLFAAGLLGGGALFLGIGIPLIVVGAKEVPVHGAAPTAQAQLRVGAGSAELSMGF